MTIRNVFPPTRRTHRQNRSSADSALAGDRLITVGDYAKGVPPNAVTAAEVKALEIQLHQFYQTGPGTDMPEYTYPNPLYQIAEVQSVTDELWDFVGTKIRRVRASRLGKKEMGLLDGLMLLPPLPSSSAGAVLRNLDRKVYIRDDSVADADSDFPSNLGDVACVKTLWTEDSSGTMKFGCHGVWAGARFDIVGLEEVKGVKGWVDGSPEAVEVEEEW